MIVGISGPLRGCGPLAARDMGGTSDSAGSVGGAAAPLDAPGPSRVPRGGWRALTSGAVTPRRQQILDIAADLFAARGFHGVSVAELGAACGISGPALYKHFESKDAMLAEMLVTISETLLAEGRSRVAPGRRPARGARGAGRVAHRVRHRPPLPHRGPGPRLEQPARPGARAGARAPACLRRRVGHAGPPLRHQPQPGGLAHPGPRALRPAQLHARTAAGCPTRRCTTCSATWRTAPSASPEPRGRGAGHLRHQASNGLSSSQQAARPGRPRPRRRGGRRAGRGRPGA